MAIKTSAQTLSMAKTNDRANPTINALGINNPPAGSCRPYGTSGGTRDILGIPEETGRELSVWKK